MIEKSLRAHNASLTSLPKKALPDLANQLYAVHLINETPTVRGLAADNNNKLYTETMIFLWNNHCNLNFIM